MLDESTYWWNAGVLIGRSLTLTYATLARGKTGLHGHNNPLHAPHWAGSQSSRSVSQSVSHSLSQLKSHSAGSVMPRGQADILGCDGQGRMNV